MFEFIIGLAASVFAADWLVTWTVDNVVLPLTWSTPPKEPVKKLVNTNTEVKLSEKYKWAPEVLDDDAWYKNCYPRHDGKYLIRCGVVGEGGCFATGMMVDYHIINGEPRWGIDTRKIPDYHEGDKLVLIEWTAWDL